jgi:hypothetical protein
VAQPATSNKREIVPLEVSTLRSRLLKYRRIDGRFEMTESTNAKGTAERLEKLEAFFKEVGDLTSNHETLHDHAVDYPSDLGKALEKVDPDWWRSKGSSMAAECIGAETA